MSNIIILTKLFLKNGIGKPRTNKVKGIFRALLILIVMGGPAYILMSTIGTGSYIGYGILKKIGQEGLLISTSFVTVSFMMFIFGIFTSLTYFYFTSDLDTILPLPVKPYEIVLSKFIVVAVMQYVIEGVVIAPILIGFGVASSAGFIYYLSSAIIFFLLPVTPLIFALIICMLVMSFSSLGKNKEKFKTISAVFGLLIAVGSKSLFDLFPSSVSNPESIKVLLETQANSPLTKISNVFFTLIFAKNSIIHSGSFIGYINLFAFLIITAISLIIVCVIAETLYFKGAIGMSNVLAKRKVLTAEQFSKNTVVNSVVKAYFLKEMRVLLRTSAFLMNCIMRSLILPIMLIIYLILKLKEMMNVNGTDLIGGAGGIFIIVVFVGVLLLSSTSNIGTSAISRDGKNAFVMKYIPIEYEVQIIAKILPTVAINMIYVVILIVAFIILKTPVIIAIFALILAVVGIIFSALTATLLDINRPKLDWDNEYAAVTKNISTLINLGINLICVAFVYIPMELGLGATSTFLIILTVYVCLVSLIILYIKKNSQKMFNRIM